MGHVYVEEDTEADSLLYADKTDPGDRPATSMLFEDALSKVCRTWFSDAEDLHHPAGRNGHVSVHPHDLLRPWGCIRLN